MGLYATATQTARRDPYPELAKVLDEAWWGVGVISQHYLQGGRARAAIAYWYCTTFNGSSKARAQEALDALEERALATGDPTAFRVVYTGPALTEIASSVYGLRMFRRPFDAPLGAVVRPRLIEHEIVELTLV